MSTSALFRPGVSLGNYPQRFEPETHFVERLGARFKRDVQALASPARYKTAFITRRVNGCAADLDSASSQYLEVAVKAIRGQLGKRGLQDELVFRCFALIREFSSRVLSMRHFDVQLLGGWIMVNGMLAEMQTGEGKTLTAVLPAATAALAGIPVHVITSNEYLAERDAMSLQPLYDALGLSVGVIKTGMSFRERQETYARDIVYCTNQQLGFDYLRDRIATGGEAGPQALRLKMYDGESSKLLLRGLCFAVVDEADSVLIDEARTPLVIAREHNDTQQLDASVRALAIARKLDEFTDFVVNRREAEVTLTDAGKEKVHKAVAHLGGIWNGRMRSQFLVSQALQALHLYLRDKHYIVSDGKVAIIDQQSGRAQPDRSWQSGLHQMIECKEGCATTSQRETLASISYQRFFRRFLKLGGMSGTLSELKPELRRVYQLTTVTVPPHRPCLRKNLPLRMYADQERKWSALVNRIAAVNEQGQPVLVGTCTVEASEHLSALLTRANLPHQVLNARQDQEEADIVASAGQRGQITIATNMAGRGTDIKLGDGVNELGGLHVIATEFNDSRRIDRQLFGRAARQGDPGSSELIVALNDHNTWVNWPAWVISWLARCAKRKDGLPSWLAWIVARTPQLAVERRHREIRYQLLKNELRLSKYLAFTGELE